MSRPSFSEWETNLKAGIEVSNRDLGEPELTCCQCGSPSPYTVCGPCTEKPTAVSVMSSPHRQDRRQKGVPPLSPEPRVLGGDSETVVCFGAKPGWDTAGEQQKKENCAVCGLISRIAPNGRRIVIREGDVTEGSKRYCPGCSHYGDEKGLRARAEAERIRKEKQAERDAADEAAERQRAKAEVTDRSHATDQIEGTDHE